MELNKFESYLLRKGLREDTIAAHLQRMKHVLNSVGSLSPESFEEFLMNKKRNGIKGSSLNRFIITLRSYGAFKELEWTKTVPLFKEEATNKAIFSDSEIEAIISLERPPRFRFDVWDRWTMWLRILAFSGMRASEVSTLKPEQIDFGTNTFILDHTKTIPRRVPIANNLLPDLEKYVKASNKWLFPSPTKRGHVWRSGWHKHFNIRKDSLGLKRPNLTVHSFRHSFISNLWEEAVPLPDIMNIVGHKKPETTLKYSHLGMKSAQKSINKHSIIRKNISSKNKLKLFLEYANQAGLMEDEEFEWILEQDFIAIWEKGKRKKRIEFE